MTLSTLDILISSANSICDRGSIVVWPWAVIEVPKKCLQPQISSERTPAAEVGGDGRIINQMSNAMLVVFIGILMRIRACGNCDMMELDILNVIKNQWPLMRMVLFLLFQGQLMHVKPGGIGGVGGIVTKLSLVPSSSCIHLLL
jgi:hypothetical protein